MTRCRPRAKIRAVLNYKAYIKDKYPFPSRSNSECRLKSSCRKIKKLRLDMTTPAAAPQKLETPHLAASCSIVAFFTRSGPAGKQHTAATLLSRIMNKLITVLSHVAKLLIISQATFVYPWGPKERASPNVITGTRPEQSGWF